MEEGNIWVTLIDGDQWGVSFRNPFDEEAGGEDVFMRMQSKEDAVRYARICEQRTNSVVHIGE
jgi:hypothetical protein